MYKYANVSVKQHKDHKSYGHAANLTIASQVATGDYRLLLIELLRLNNRVRMDIRETGTQALVARTYHPPFFS